MFLTPEERELRLIELQKISVPLDTDPVSMGLLTMTRKIAEIQGFKDRVNCLLLEAIKNKHEAETVYNQINFDYEAHVTKSLATDPEVQNQKSEKLRIAVAETKISEVVLKRHHLELELSDAESYYKMVQQSYMHLESVYASLSKQILVIEMSLQIKEIRPEDLGGTLTKHFTVSK